MTGDRARLIAASTLVLQLALSIACTPRRAQEEAANDTENIVPVGGEIVRAGSIRAVIHATGVVTPAPDAEFLALAPEPARIAEITRDVGQPAASGDILVRFDIPSASESVGRQRAEVARLQALVENARIAQARARDLFERGIISRREMEDADRELANAQAEVGRAEVARTAAESALARAVIRAPFNGIVVARLHNPGDLVQGTATDPVLRLVDPARLEVTATIRAADSARVQPGATARIAGAADTPPVRLLVALRAPSPTGTSDVLVRLTFMDMPTLAVDTPVEVDIDAEERSNVVLIPAAAVLGEGADAAVFVASGNRAERRSVTIGVADEARVEITSGLKRGELLITRGHAGLIDGTAVTVDTRGALQ
jgi:cobalt-zinc-cadmium efflux system membrane fusion protein